MSDSLPAYKRKSLEGRRAALVEEHEAINKQLGYTSNARERLQLKRQIDDLERQIQEIDNMLTQSPGSGAIAEERTRVQSESVPQSVPPERLQRHKRISELVRKCSELRPNVCWEEVPEPSKTENLLTEARALLEKGSPDEAVKLLERRPFSTQLREQINEILRSPIGRGVGAFVVIAVLVASSVWLWPLVSSLLFPPTPGPTPMLSDAQVNFIITYSTGEKEIIPGGGILTLAPGKRVLVETSVTVDQLPFPHELIYQYSALKGQITSPDIPMVSYIALDQSGRDIIKVSITDKETGEEVSHSINIVTEN